MKFAEPEQFTVARDAARDAAKRGGFFATLLRALRAGAAVRIGRKPAGAEPLYFHGNPRAF